MRFLDNLRIGFSICLNSICFLYDFPKFLVPLIVGIVLNLAVGSLWSAHFYDIEFEGEFDAYFILDNFPFIACSYLIFAIIEVLMISVVLEMIRQIRDGEELCVAKAYRVTASVHIVRLFPFALFWAGMRLVFMFLDSLLRIWAYSKRGGDLFEHLLSWVWGFFYGYINLTYMMSLPAICWDGHSGFSGLRQGFRHSTGQFGNVVVGMMVQGFASLALAIVAVLVALCYVYFVPINGLTPYLAGGLVLVFLSINSFIEIVYSAELYSWAQRWEATLDDALEKGEAHPLQTVLSIERPNIIGALKMV